MPAVREQLALETSTTMHAMLRAHRGTTLEHVTLHGDLARVALP